MIKALIKLVVFWGIILYFPGETPSETIYKWINKEGVPCYSNVSPPQDEADYQTISSEKDNEEQTARVEPVPTDQPKPKDNKKKEEKIDHKILKKYLSKRIEERKQSIKEIEKLLRSRPNDNSLKKSLRLKQQYLQKDLKKFQNLKD
ncbi:MAG: hypothetical protein JRI65_12920 [Deltaproteobacteria bacterium]|nr:hypothetical protein [Deltaproteobacteria bacterium]